MNPDLVYLVQTDTTVGFSSSNDEKLSNIKQRPSNQKILKTLDSFVTLKEFARVPKKFRKIVRNSSKTTFIYPNLDSFRVVKSESSFFDFIKKTKKSFEYDFAFEKCDVEVISNVGFFETSSSKIYKLGKKRLKKIR